jgi:imidazolonepropionase-like amidohydrolase
MTHKNWRTALAAGLVACAAAGSALAEEKIIAIVGANLVRPDEDKAHAVIPNTTIIVRGNLIDEMGATGKVKVPPGATVINARGKWVIPGLVDAHVHFFQSGNLYTRPDAADFGAYMPYAKEMERTKARLPVTFRSWIASGVTSVVDIGGPMWNFEMRAQADAQKDAPRVAVAGPLISMVDRPQLDLGDPPIIKITTPDAARALARNELLLRPDFLKVWFIHRPGDDLAAQEAIVKAAVDTAREFRVRTAVHATELDVAKASLRAGADYLVHSVEDQPIDDEFIALAKKNNILYCPTLFVTSGYRYALSNTWKPTEAEKRLADPQILNAMGDLSRMPKSAIPERVAKLMANPPKVQVSEIALKNLKRVWDEGITVVMGTDAGNIGTLHGPSVFREMELMTRAGLTPLEVLRTATANGARAMNRDMGTLDPGKLADLVILDADPTKDVQNLSRIYRVMKDGVLFDPRTLLRP